MAATPTLRNPRTLALSAALLALATLSPVTAMGARPAGTSSATIRDSGDCTIDTTYEWANFGNKNTSAYSIIALYLRQPGVGDVLMSFSQQSDNPGQNLKVGTNAYRFSFVRQWLQTHSTIDPDSRLVAVGELLAEPKNRDNYLVTEARAEATLPVPAACLVF